MRPLSPEQQALKARRAHVALVLGPGNYRFIGRHTGISFQHISRVLRGEAGISFHKAAHIAEAVDVTLDELWQFLSSTPGLRIQGMRMRSEAYRTNQRIDNDRITRKSSWAINYPQLKASRQAAKL